MISDEKNHGPMLFSFDMRRGRGYNDPVMTVKAQLHASTARRVERPASESAGVHGSIRSMVGSVRPGRFVTVDLAGSGHDLSLVPCLGAYGRKTEAAHPG